MLPPLGDDPAQEAEQLDQIKTGKATGPYQVATDGA